MRVDAVAQMIHEGLLGLLPGAWRNKMPPSVLDVAQRIDNLYRAEATATSPAGDLAEPKALTWLRDASSKDAIVAQMTGDQLTEVLQHIDNLYAQALRYQSTGVTETMAAKAAQSEFASTFRALLLHGVSNDEAVADAWKAALAAALSAQERG